MGVARKWVGVGGVRASLQRKQIEIGSCHQDLSRDVKKVFRHLKNIFIGHLCALLFLVSSLTNPGVFFIDFSHFTKYSFFKLKNVSKPPGIELGSSESKKVLIL